MDCEVAAPVTKIRTLFAIQLTIRPPVHPSHKTIGRQASEQPGTRCRSLSSCHGEWPSTFNKLFFFFFSFLLHMTPLSLPSPFPLTPFLVLRSVVWNRQTWGSMLLSCHMPAGQQVCNCPPVSKPTGHNPAVPWIPGDVFRHLS